MHSHASWHLRNGTSSSHWQEIYSKREIVTALEIEHPSEEKPLWFTSAKETDYGPVKTVPGPMLFSDMTCLYFGHVTTSSVDACSI